MYEEKEPVKKVKKEKIKHENKFFTNTKDNKKVKENENPKKDSNVKSKGIKFLTFRADYVSVLIRFGIFLLFAFVAIFIITKIRNSGDAKTFTENMEKMKEVAYIYYKVDKNRPVLVGDEVVMTLGDMEESSLINELKDKKKNVCSKEYSYVSLIKTDENNYDLEVYLSCGGEAQMATYPVNYDETSDNEEDNDSSSEKTLLYELKRTVTTNEQYSCPEGYYGAGKYCVSFNNTDVIDATAKYKVKPEINTKAKYKASGYEYEYVDPILNTNPSSYKCSSGYTLNGTKCVKEGTVYYKTSNSYSCPNGGTPSGTKCLFTTYASYKDEIAYCKNGTLINNSTCYITKDYSVSCITGKKDSSINACYTTYSPTEELSDWLFDGKVTYREDYDVDHLESETKKYEVDEWLDNGKVRYNRYIKVYNKICDDGDELVGSTCRHYDESYEKRYCSGSDYHLSSDESECYTYDEPYYRNTNGSYTCPDGYSKKGVGVDTTCYKYENATKTTNKVPYCGAIYDLTSDGRCLRTVDADLVNEEIVYTCPEGYTKTGSGQNTKCYKKARTDSYYYCSDSEATLRGTRCIIPSSTSFLAYSCPLGYDLSGNKCVKTNAVNRILATENDGPTTKEEVIWSKEQNLDGWTWTGNIKEAE